MKKNYYSRIITDPHFKSLSDFNIQQPITEGQIELSKKLSNDYGLTEDKFLHLIQYVEFAFIPDNTENNQRLFEEIGRMIDDDSKKDFTINLEYENKHSEIVKNGDSITFNYGSTPYKGKKIFLEESIKKIATEIFNQLTKEKNISKWQSLCIIGFIYAFYQIGINYNYPILTEEVHKIKRPGENYLSYLSGNIKRYIIK
jgi:hypothetical protein